MVKFERRRYGFFCLRFRPYEAPYVPPQKNHGKSRWWNVPRLFPWWKWCFLGGLTEKITEKARALESSASAYITENGDKHRLYYPICIRKASFIFFYVSFLWTFQIYLAFSVRESRKKIKKILEPSTMTINLLRALSRSLYEVYVHAITINIISNNMWTISYLLFLLHTRQI